MGKASVLAGLDAQRRATTRRLRALEDEAWRRPTAAGLTGAELAEWLIAVDEAAVRGRWGALATPRPAPPKEEPARARGHEERPGAAGGSGDAQLLGGDPRALLDRLDRAGTRLRRGMRILPGLLWRTRVEGDDGLRRSLVCLLRLRVLREWVAVADPVLGPPTSPAPPVARILARAALERLPVEVLPNLDVRVGVLRVVLAEIPGQPAGSAWGIDFARKHYGPRVDAQPDAVVRTWSGALARLLEGDADWSALPAGELRVEGDEELAAVWLAALTGDHRG